eukprot:TRINITY_DN13967_c0_g1_i2.p1 TRINITY_DN13967_c0_g1~~TRINITY_DN13967_c0_g1_i2.p1  ORF type:complete len:110 (+),score=17.64 TRINITY_DN13967_c0_g1_i2:67-396(+)
MTSRLAVDMYRKLRHLGVARSVLMPEFFSTRAASEQFNRGFTAIRRLAAARESTSGPLSGSVAYQCFLQHVIRDVQSSSVAPAIVTADDAAADSRAYGVRGALSAEADR